MEVVFYTLRITLMLIHSNYLICGQQHLKGHISECVDGRDGTGRDAVEVGQHKVPEVLQLGQEEVLNMRDNLKKWLILAKLLLSALLLATTCSQ